MHQLLNLSKSIKEGAIPPFVIFNSKVYPLIFFKLLKDLSSGLFIDLDTADFDQFKSKLVMTFLGSKSTYLVNLSLLSASTKSKFINFIKDYKGPNALLVFTDNANDFDDFINLDEVKDKNFTDILKFLNIYEKNCLSSLLEKVFVEKLSVDELLVLYSYSVCLGSQKDSFKEKWLGRIVSSDSSLFELSKHFFARDRINFFQLWDKVEKAYSDMFWISFFSEQIYRTYFYALSRRANDVVAAKQISYKLPFSFIQKDWKFMKSSTLLDAHKDLYNLDYAIKNGASNLSLDLFLTRYFAPILS